MVIGAGQAGLAASYYLSEYEIKHVILERGSIANAWRTQRWDTFCLVTPNWTINLPGAVYSGGEPNGFMPKDEFVRYLEDWADTFDAPVLAGVCATEIKKAEGKFEISSNAGSFLANQVVVATATYQEPLIPTIFEKPSADFDLLTAIEYRTPSQIADGGILVVGSGQSGCQIAEELNLSGRRTFLSVGHTGRLPRRYRGSDCIQWQLEMGWLDRTSDFLATPEMRFRGDPHLSGASGGRTLSLHQLQEEGVRLVGRIEKMERGVLKIKEDLWAAIDASDKYATEFRAAVDQYIERSGRKAPLPTIEEMTGEPIHGIQRVEIIKSLDLFAEDITTIILATGFKFDFSWIKFPILDATGYPITDKGITEIPGLYFLGLNWMSKRKSGIIYGVAEDAEYIGTRIFEYFMEKNQSSVAAR